MTPIFRWNGQYFGFVCEKYIYSADGDYVGCIDKDNKVWAKSGNFLGQLIEENYVMKNLFDSEPIPRHHNPPKTLPEIPKPITDRHGKIPQMGWVDSLEEQTLALFS